MREIALDIETTGLNANDGDRIVEIGCVEIIDKVVTGDHYHVYINPERELDEAAQNITGLTYAMLKKYRRFDEEVRGFLDYIGEDRIIIHNASFDAGFLNVEMENCGIDYRLEWDRIVDTLAMARSRYPGAPASLDALCRRFNVNNSGRVKHGALIDAELLAYVYCIMSVNIRQTNLFASVEPEKVAEGDSTGDEVRERCINRTLYTLTDEEQSLHSNFVASSLKNPIWNR